MLLFLSEFNILQYFSPILNFAKYFWKILFLAYLKYLKINCLYTFANFLFSIAENIKS